MTEDFIRRRITQLRLQKGLSEYQLSLDLGHSKGYIQSITSGRALPSMGEFLYLCEYFGVSPKEFFDENESNPITITKAVNMMRQLDETDQRLLLEIGVRFLQEKQ